MTLYSTETQTNARVGNWRNGREGFSRLEVEKCVDSQSAYPWCYLFVHHAKVKAVSKRLEERFRVFIHKSTVYKRDSRHIRKEEQPSVSGLVFVQGDSKHIQNFLRIYQPDLHLVKDCSTQQTAVIPDSVMQPFMRLAEFNPTRIRFMPHAFDYYSIGNPLIRITSGILSGFEGYRIRISRDKCLVTSIGGLTVAIGGIHRESFENLDEYVRLRREQLKKMGESLSSGTFTPLQAEMERSFLLPQTPLDIMALAGNLVPWVERMQQDIKKKDFDEAAEIGLFLLEETGCSFRAVSQDVGMGETKNIMSVCKAADDALLVIMESADVSTDLKEIVGTRRKSLTGRFPFLPISL